MKDRGESILDKLKENIGFLQKFLQNPKQNASIRPTTDKTAGMICTSIQRKNIKTVIELGPVTRHIVTKLNKNTKYYGIDLEQEYIHKLQKKYEGTKNMKFIYGSIEDLSTIIDTNNIGHIDLIISTLPYIAFIKYPEALNIIKKCTDEGTIFRGISYYPRAFNKTFKLLNPKIINHTRQNIPYVFIHGVN